MGLVLQNRTGNGVDIRLAYEGFAAAPPFIGPDTVDLGEIGRPAALRFDGAVMPGNLFLELAPVNSTSHSGTRVFPVKDGRVILPAADEERYRARVFLDRNGAVDADLTLCDIHEPCPITEGIVRMSWDYIEDITQDNSNPEPGAIIPAFRSRAVGAGASVNTRTIRIPVSGIPAFHADMSAGAAGNIELYRGTLSESVALAPVGRWGSNAPLIAGENVTLRIRNTAGAMHQFYIDLVVLR